MFEYITATGKRISINPKYITAISEANCNKGQCYIFTVNDSCLVGESYEVVCTHYNNWLLGGLTNG